MYYDKVSKVEDIKRLTEGPNAGLIQCGDSHFGGGYYRAKLREPAAVVFSEEDANGKVKELVLVCKRHAGTIKANITKGSWGFRGAEIVEGVSVEAAALNPAALITTLTQAKMVAKAVRETANANRELTYKREHWTEERADYNADLKDGWDSKVTLTNSIDDPFSRVYVVTVRSYLTPKQARRVAMDLLTAADNADDLTAIAMKP